MNRNKLFYLLLRKMDKNTLQEENRSAFKNLKRYGFFSRYDSYSITRIKSMNLLDPTHIF